MKKFLIIVLLSLIVQTAPSFSETPQEKQEEFRKVMEEGRGKIQALVEERNQMAAKGATPEELQKKLEEIQNVEKSFIEKLKTLAPEGMTPSGRPPQPRALSPEEQQELKALVEKRRELVMKGAGHEEISDLTKQIRDIYAPQPDAGAPAQVSPPQTENKSLPAN